MAHSRLQENVKAVRHFSRFYTRQLGILSEGVYHTPFSLTEVRVLYELAHRQAPTATQLGTDLGLDAGYLSRILRAFEKRDLLQRNPSKTDGRQNYLSLTAHGRNIFAPIDARSASQVSSLLRPLSPVNQNRLVGAMRTIEDLLGSPSEKGSSAKSLFLLRPHQPGDMGWVVHRHGALYAQEYGYNEEFEALVAEIVAKFIQNLEAKRERCWIAEKDGEIVGTIFLVKKSKTVAKLRLLLVEPKARGLGIGSRLVSECVRFARAAGYRKITLWTQSELKGARRLYEQAGFSLIDQHRHHSFGKNLVAETWDLRL